MFSLVQLQCFVAVAEELHFGQAAERLRMTQPPLSRQIQQLERELGTQLFERSSRRVTLTEPGRVLLPSARRIIDLAAKAAADVRSVGAGSSGTLTVSYTAMAGQSVLPVFLRRVAAELPGVAVLLRELVTADQIDELERGTVDLAFLRPAVLPPPLASRAVLREGLVLAVPSESPLAERVTPIPLRDAQGEPFLMYSPAEARYFHDIVAGLLVGAGVTPRIAQYAAQVPALLALVSAGLGVALVPASARSLAVEGVVFQPIAETPEVPDAEPVRLDAVWRRDATNPALAAVLPLIGEGGEGRSHLQT